MVESGNDVFLNAPLSGSGDLTKTGAGTLLLRGNNSSYDGRVYVEASVLAAGRNDSIGPETVVDVAAGATLRLEDFESFGGLTGEGEVDTHGHVLAPGSNDADSTFSGVISGSGSFTKIGSGTMALSGSSTFSGGTTISDGVLLAAHDSALGSGAVSIDGGLLRIAGGATQDNAISFSASGGTLGGTGTIRSDITIGNGSTVGPGASPGLLTIDGDYTQQTGAAMEMELGGLIRGDEYDALVITGTADLAGTLDVVLYGGFDPAEGDTFDILDWGTLATGSQFDTINLPGLSGGLVWNTSNLYNTGEITVTPEPATMTLLGLGGLVLLLRRRRRNG
ncbi:MAG: autotransporter-associated beta strand repeat-containing protein [Phycisphaerae bacterium]|nr:autotransporter-associated beta strand repeat-containing protein [Phycisphaerae bacterium]